MSKVMMAAAFGAGYVLGARAGRERYEELSSKAQELWEHPKVQEQASKVQERVGKVQDQAKDRMSSEGTSASQTQTDPWAATPDSVLSGGDPEPGHG